MTIVAARHPSKEQFRTPPVFPREGYLYFEKGGKNMPGKKVLDEKIKVVEDLASELKAAQSIVIAEYRGLTVEQDTAMRAALRKGGVKYRVVKNTLSGRAMKIAGIEGMDNLLQGPTAIAYSLGDVLSTAKIVKEYADKYDKLVIKGGVLDGQVISADEVTQLARIPSKEVLYGQVVFGLVSPIASLAMVLNAIKENMEKSEVAAE
jgi:large subunit ribosomal protein L10